MSKQNKRGRSLIGIKKSKKKNNPHQKSLSYLRKPKKKSNKKSKSIQKEDGYQYIKQAQDYEKRNKLVTAIELYEKGIKQLLPTLNSIQTKREKEERSLKIDGYRHQQQRCKMKLDEQLRAKNKVIIDKTAKKQKIKDIKHEAGYILCVKAEKYEKEKKYKAAITHYEKGIPMLEDTLQNINNSTKKRERMKHIEKFRHSCQKVKNLITRRKSIVSKPKRVVKDNYVSGYRKPTVSPVRKHISGGVLYKNIRNGNLTVDIVRNCDYYSMYFMLDVVASSCIHLPLPFQSCLRDPLVEALNCRIEVNDALQQKLRCFLYSLYSKETVQALWGDHPCMPYILSNITDDNNDDNDRNNQNNDDQDELKFDEKYLERDAIYFYHKLIESQPTAGDEFIVANDIELYDIMGRDQIINKVKVNKVFKSNAKPLLLTSFQKQGDVKYKKISTFILKSGDDLRKDSGAIHMFRFMNSIWKCEDVYYFNYPVTALLYNVIPMGNNLGCIEFIDGCKPLRDVLEYQNQLNEACLQQLVASAAGSYIASFILGVRDRHFDNVLIRGYDGTVFHIDFGFVFGESLFFDAAKIALTSDLKKVMDNHWDNFIETALNAFMTLRLHYQELVDFAILVFDFEELNVKPSEWLYKMLMIGANDNYVQNKIRNKLSNAPTAWNTRFKNTVHAVATATM